MTPTVALPRGSTTGFKTAFLDDRGTHLYRFPDFLTDLKAWSDIDDLFVPNGDDTTGKHVGARIACGGMSADNGTGLIRVHLAFKVMVKGVEFWSLREYATLTCTAGAMNTGASNQRIADTIVAVLGTYGTFLEARTGARAASALSVADVANGMAEYQIPDLDNCDGLVLDTQVTGTINPIVAFTT